MIRYRLKCKKGHEFEGWFASSAAYDLQAKRGQVTCPSCGINKVSKALMAPNVAKRSRKKEPEAAQAPSKQEGQRVAAHGELIAAMRKLRAEIEAKPENAGKRIPEEARKIHYEESPARGIHGEATAEEAKALAEEGIDFFPLPILPEDRN